MRDSFDIAHQVKRNASDAGVYGVGCIIPRSYIASQVQIMREVGLSNKKIRIALIVLQKVIAAK